MAVTAQEASIIQQELYVFLTGEQANGIRSVMRAAGYAGHAAKIIDVTAEFVTAIHNAYGNAPPTVSP
jgi:hypothetical protein